jgi:hypothetical protein
MIHLFSVIERNQVFINILNMVQVHLNLLDSQYNNNESVIIDRFGVISFIQLLIKLN